MIKTTLQYCATDKEIFDALMSAKQKIGEKVLLELAKDRGIFYSPKDTREDLVSAISLLPHDFHDLNTLLEQREHSGRQEKLTSVTLPVTLTVDEIKEVIKEYMADSPADERVTHHGKGTDQVVVNIKYSEVDYGKTRLVQRTPREAGIEFHVEADKTVIRMPSNDRIKGVFDKLKDRLDSKKKTDIPAIRIEIGEFQSPAIRTEFFTSLISDLKGFQLSNVTSVKVEKLKQAQTEEEFDLDDDLDTEEAKQEALALVKNVALKGETLLASEEYQSLSKKGFFITSIIWRSRLAKPSYPIVEFEAAFEEPFLGKGFKYFVRGAYNMVDKQYTKTVRPVEPEDKEKYLSLIEETAAATIATLRKKVDAEAAKKEPKPGAKL
jgi:hypothetical protein